MDENPPYQNIVVPCMAHHTEGLRAVLNSHFGSGACIFHPIYFGKLLQAVPSCDSSS